MPRAIQVKTMAELEEAILEGLASVKSVVEGKAGNLAVAGKQQEFQIQKGTGAKKVNIFILVHKDLYDQIKDKPWTSKDTNEWKGAKGIPSETAQALLDKHQPAKALEGGTEQQVGIYEKEPGVPYYDAAEPSLNLELKFLSAAKVKVTTPDGSTKEFPKQVVLLNAHIKQVGTMRDNYNKPVGLKGTSRPWDKK